MTSIDTLLAVVGRALRRLFALAPDYFAIAHLRPAAWLESSQMFTLTKG